MGSRCVTSHGSSWSFHESYLTSKMKWCEEFSLWQDVFQSILLLGFEYISPISNTAKTHLLSRGTVWSERIGLKSGKETRFQLEFLFRNKPTVEAKQTQEVKHFKGLHYPFIVTWQCHIVTSPFPVESLPICKKSRWPSNTMAPSPFPPHWTSIKGATNQFRIRKVARQV